MFAQNDAYALSFLCGWIMSGFVAGLLPLIVGLARGQQGLAWGGFAACAVSGLVGALLLAGPVAIVFTIIIVAQPANDGGRRRRYRDYDDDDRDDYRDRDSRRRFREDRDVRRRYEDEDRPRSRYRDEDEDRRETDRRTLEDKRPRDDRQGGKGFGYRESDDY